MNVGAAVGLAAAVGGVKYEQKQVLIVSWQAEIIEQLWTQQNWLMTTSERENRMMNGVSEEIQNKFFKEVLG